MALNTTSSGGGTSTNAQWSPGTTARQTLTKDGLTPGTSYVLVIQAIKNNADGTKSISDYASIPYTASTKGASGLNQLSINNGTDIQLNGGALYATTTDAPFAPNVGLFDVVNGTTTGTGVIVNSTGIAGFKAGSKTFYIDASSGTAVFAGNVTSNATIAGINASTVVSNASLGAQSYTYAYTAVQPGTFLKVDNSNQVVTVDTTGINITSSATASANGTSRIEMTNNYFTAYAGNTPTFQIQASSGSVVMTGQVTATSGYIGSASQGWQINSDNIASRSGNLVLKASDGSISGGTITGSLFKTSTSSTRIEIGSLNTATNQYDNISFYTDATSGYTYGAAGRLLVGGGSGTATLTIASPNFDSRNNTPGMITMTSYSDTSTPSVTIFGNLTLSAGSVVSGTYQNALRGISAQSTAVTAGSTIGSGYNNGDVLLVYA